MDYFNPFMRNMQTAPASPMYGQRQPLPQINPQQFRQFAITLNDQSLNGFAQMARQRGISEHDIQEGIRIIKSL